MNYYVLTLPQSFTTFQTIVSGGEIHYTLKSPELDGTTFDGLVANDVIYMYYAKPKDVIPMMFRIKDVEDGIIILEKEIERYPGVNRPFLNNPALEEEVQVDTYFSSIDSALGNKINEELFQYAPLYIKEEYKIEENDDTQIYKEAKELARKIKTFTQPQRGGDPHNLIYFGAPGTGKSYTLNEKVKGLFKEKDYERVTFFNRYTYGNFIGTYKPVKADEDITYKFVSGPFIRTLIKSYEAIIKADNPESVSNVALIIEELNRADAASVFGDMFQLLDRKDGKSEYEVNVSSDLQEELCTQLIPKYNQIVDPSIKEKCLDLWSSIYLPSNFYLWATMNSADQGVYPMDTAFKRRWDFIYLNINENQEKIKNTIVKLQTRTERESFDWNELRIKINDRLLSECNVDEDKLLGPFFLSYSLIRETQENPEGNSPIFIEKLKNKVFMYLYEDAARHYRNIMFSGVAENSSFSDICNAFDNIGLEIFKFKTDKG